MTDQTPTTTLPLGRVLATRGALLAVAQFDPETGPLPLFRRLVERHARGDWGAVCPEDAEANREALATGGRVMSVYTDWQDGNAAEDTPALWIITEADRSYTTLMLPEEY